MSDRVDLEYNVQVTGLEEAQASANSASESANQASLALTGARSSASSSLPTMLMTVRAMNATRLAITQTSRAITNLNPTALMYGFLNMIQVVRNLTALTRMLKESTGAAAAAQSILATLTGNWWVIPLALAAGALVYSRIKSMQAGGPVSHTGVYMLHRGEYVVPAQETRLGPIFVTFERQPRSPLEVDQWLDELGPRLTEKMRRGG
ncbi:MAG TPA: hypothetical protein VMW03_01690 [Candidatus Krumholzibacteriaceae bacterium]|nr:hypothetical protein [Candidatus Krumholzibacteriaceae bacterium]